MEYCHGGYIILCSFQNPQNYVTQRMNPNVNYDFWLVIMYWFMSYNKYIAVVKDVNNRGNCGTGRRGIWELSVFSDQFFGKLKLLFKKIVY